MFSITLDLYMFLHIIFLSLFAFMHKISWNWCICCRGAVTAIILKHSNDTLNVPNNKQINSVNLYYLSILVWQYLSLWYFICSMILFHIVDFWPSSKSNVLSAQETTIFSIWLLLISNTRTWWNVAGIKNPWSQRCKIAFG